MKPLLLKMKGINSFYEEQVINFEKIIDRGIFGIFGDTGSGKSTIIDAITLALYGKINRYDGKNGNREFINTNSTTSSITFKFSIKTGKKDTIYTIVKQFKKDKETGTAKSGVARLSINNGKGEEIISDKASEISYKIEKIIGLNYNDFTRAVVLPQGKFSEFLMLENKDKRNMLERIFNLEKYGTKLTEKINEKKRVQEAKVKEIETKLEPLFEINKESFEILENQISLEKNSLLNFEREIININKSINDFEKNLNLKKDLDKYKKELSKLNSNISEIKKDKEILQKSKKASILYPYLEELNKITNDILNIKNNIKSKEVEKINLSLKYEKAKTDYEKIENNKLQEEPLLSQLKIKLEQAILIEKNIFEISKDINTKKDDLFDKEKKSSKLKNSLQNLNDTKIEQQQKLENIKKFKKDNKIDLNFREKIEEATKLEDEFNNFKKEILKNESKIKKELENLKEKENNQKNLVIQVDELSKKIDELDFKQKFLYKENELNTEEISNKENEIFKLKTEFNNANEKQENLQNLILEKNNKKEDLSLILDEIVTIKNNKVEVEQKINEIDFLTKQHIEESIIGELVKKLVEGCSCPVCGSKEHPNPAKIATKEIYNKFEYDKKELETKLKNINLTLEKRASKKTVIETKINEISHNIKELEKYFKKYNIKLQEEKISKLEENVFTQKNNLKIYEEISQKITSFKSKKSNLETMISFINSEILAINESILISKEENESLNYKFNKCNKTLNNLKLELKINDFKKEYEKIKLVEKELEEKNQIENQIQKNIEKIRLKAEEINKEVTTLEQDIASFNTSIKEKEIQMNNLKEQTKEFSHIKSLEDELNIVTERLFKITETERQSYNILKNLEEEFRKINEDYNILISKLDTFEKNQIEKEEKLNKQMEIESFTSYLEIEKYFLTKQQQNEIELKIQDFDNKFNYYTLNIKTILKTLENEDLDKIEEKFENLSKRKKELEKSKEDKTENVIRLNIELESFTEKLKNKEQLEKSLKLENDKLDLFIELFTLNKGGLFVEYIATNNLKQIVIDAGARLKDMSGDKFSIELKGSDFIIKDYHNGGITRTPRGLSGGEIFMCSLSLALALSSKLQLTNQAPLEVFFLDEGFGTLDNNLLNTVISSLEKLQTQNVSVGIITHVEELKNRISSKILVEYNENELGAKLSII